MAVQTAELRLDCQKCTPADKNNNGCMSLPADPSRWIFESEPLKRCPARLITSMSLCLLKYYNFFKQGFLINNGSLAHQPAKMIDAFLVIEDEISKLRKQKQDG